jgi:hypothetical protein
MEENGGKFADNGVSAIGKNDKRLLTVVFQ